MSLRLSIASSFFAPATVLFLLMGCSSGGASAPDCPILITAVQDLAFKDLEQIDKDEMFMVQEFADHLIGFSEQRAMKCVETAGVAWRVLARDGEQYAGTLDYIGLRINVEIERGTLIEAYLG